MARTRTRLQVGGPRILTILYLNTSYTEVLNIFATSSTSHTRRDIGKIGSSKGLSWKGFLERFFKAMPLLGYFLKMEN